MQKRYFFLFFTIIIILFNCKNRGDIEKFLTEKEIHNKFIDSYLNNRYTNEFLKMTIEFNSLWKIIVSYEKSDEYQKKLFEYFDSINREILFVGYNESKKCGVRGIVENLGYSNIEYKDVIKQNNAEEFGKYKVKFIKEEEIFLPNISGINLVYQIEINIHNIFIYNTLLFKKDSFNIRIDFWCKNTKYEQVYPEIAEIFNSIDFFTTEKYITDTTTDKTNPKIEIRDKK